MAALCAVGQAEAQSWARGHGDVSSSGARYTYKANADSQAMRTGGGAKHDAGQSAQKCKQYSNTKDPVSRKAKECDKIVEH